MVHKILGDRMLYEKESRETGLLPTKGGIRPSRASSPGDTDSGFRPL
ncbi:hypothetical protein KJZ71_00835 [Patescibacteria group bacterium]|nr:hypothetical protein [Patescibacteria group bacterium]